ncbi:hypothetical protein FG379_001227 [Cryptosporidium bovis]|uniref:uncharacterized protein n=1 Tax=Cryptosporidium bovis TaxID=310047 RepID=UPI00351A77AA|nr:hypothetical protein FG379_001227 [Cryptosporidium bovis]
MFETDANGFVNELICILQNNENKKPVRITIKKYSPQVSGCKRKKKEQGNKLVSGEEGYECYNLVRVSDGKKRKTRVVLKNENDSTTFTGELSKLLSKVDCGKTQRK